MADVFISYKSERRRAARHLVQILKLNGYSVWFDHALVRGHDYEEQIQSEIAAAKVVIVLWCAQSVASGAVRSEANYAKSKAKQVPIKIEPCEVPLFSSMTQFIDLSHWSGAPRDALFDPVLDDVEKHVGRKPVYDRDALREFESTWRDNGSFTLARFPQEAVARPQASVDFGRATAAPGLTADDRMFAEVEKVGTADALQFYLEEFPHGAHAPVVRFRMRGLMPQKATEVPDLVKAYEDGKEVAHTATLEGRIKVATKIAHGAPLLVNVGGWFKPGAGMHEWFKDHKDGPEMVVVPAGSYPMGSPADEPQRTDQETQVEVTIAEPFAIGRFAVTFDEWDACNADGGCGGYKPRDYEWGRGKQPVIDITWDEAQAYVKWLSSKTSRSYRLLSESEWEYSARAGTTTPFCWGPSITSSQANYDGSAKAYAGGGSKGEFRKRTVPVDSFNANAWGLYNVHGNVWEWTEDCWNETNIGNPGDGNARSSGYRGRRVARGCSWANIPQFLRSAYRTGFTPVTRFNHIGFRVARTLLR